MLMIKILLVCLIVVGSFAAMCNGKPGPERQNPSPILQGKPILQRTVPNGQLYIVGDLNKNVYMHVLNVTGNMYQMGYAHGLLLKKQLNEFMSELWTYIEQEFSSIFPKWVPKKLKLSLSGKTIGMALDLTYRITRKYTNSKYYQQMKGIADASGVPFLLFRRIHMIGQLTKGTCSMFGAWGAATTKGKTIQLRALDWDFDGPYWKYPLLTVYHPSSNIYGNKWMNIGFMGWVGVISGINQHKMAVSEIGVYFDDATWGKESRFGNPFTFVLRDILQFDTTLDQSITRLKNEHRTCNLLLGVGDGKLKDSSFRGFQYSHTVCNVYDDKNLQPLNSTWHPRLDNTVYWGMDWNCPGYSERLYQQLVKYYGSVSAQVTIRNILPSLDSGNLQAVVYDLTDNFVYVAYGFISNGNKINAFDRSFIKLDMTALFK